jgi:hypothetical protein
MMNAQRGIHLMLVKAALAQRPSTDQGLQIPNCHCSLHKQKPAGHQVFTNKRRAGHQAFIYERGAGHQVVINERKAGHHDRVDDFGVSNAAHIVGQAPEEDADNYRPPQFSEAEK